MNKKLLFSIYLSNALEFFDYTLFGSLSLIVHKTFFPESFSLNTAIFTFCLSLIIRPIGGFLFGFIGDKVSRSISLKLSILTMAFASLIVAICPSYEQVGYMATALIIFSRILQGISAGGEYNGAAIYAIETLKLSPYVVSGYLTSSSLCGLFIAIWCAKFVTLDVFPKDFWRVGFAFGSVIGLLSLYLRRNIHKTVSNAKNNLSLVEYHSQSLKIQIINFLLIFFISGQTSGTAYFLFVGLKPFLINQGVKVSQELVSLSLLSAVIICVLTGYLSKKIRPSLLYKTSLLATGILFPLAIMLCIKGFMGLIPMLLCCGFSLGMHGALQHAIFQNLVSKKIRQRFISFAFSLGTGLLSTAVLLITKDYALISLLWFSAVSLFAFIFLLWSKENSNTYQQTQQMLIDGLAVKQRA